MVRPGQLEQIRQRLFYGLSRYAKNLPDFYVSQRFEPFPIKQGRQFIERLRLELAGEPELLVYVHLPFCVAECAFCNTFPHPAHKDGQARYLEALLGEIDAFGRAGLFADKTLRTVYFGGGTPTCFSNEQLASILEALARHASLAVGADVTCEANPCTLTSPRRLEALRQLGIERLSLGCQSFDPVVQQLCQRIHPFEQLRQVVGWARDAGLATNVDMMVGLPGQTASRMERDLEQLAALRPDAVEVIRHEVVNPAMRELLAQRPELVVSDDELFQVVCLAQEWIEAHGYEQNGRFSSDRAFPYRYHWLKEKPLLAFGARTRSYTRAVFYEGHADLELFAKLVDRGMLPLARQMRLTQREQMWRSLFLGLQLKAGVDRDEFRERFGCDAVDTFRAALELPLALDCLQIEDGSVRLSQLGRFFVEDVCCHLMDRALETDYPSFERRGVSASDDHPDAAGLEPAPSPGSP